MAQIGSIGPYDETAEDIDTYIARVELFFIANSIPNEKKVATFLTLLGSKIFHLVQNLVSHKNPADCKYDDLVKAIKTHFKPKVIIIYERYKFHTRSQKLGESIAEFVAGLMSCARSCEFGERADDMLRDRFVVGITDAATQRALLTEADLNFQRSVSIATAREVAEKDVREMGGRDVHMIPKSFNHNSVPSKNNANSSNSKGNVLSNQCLGCGKSIGVKTAHIRMLNALSIK